MCEVSRPRAWFVCISLGDAPQQAFGSVLWHDRVKCSASQRVITLQKCNLTVEMKLVDVTVRDALRSTRLLPPCQSSYRPIRLRQSNGPAGLAPRTSPTRNHVTVCLVTSCGVSLLGVELSGINCHHNARNEPLTNSPPRVTGKQHSAAKKYVFPLFWPAILGPQRDLAGLFKDSMKLIDYLRLANMKILIQCPI